MGRIVDRMGDRGPIVDVKVMHPAWHIETLKAAGIPYGKPVVIRGLIDTGARSSAIDREVAEELKLAPHGFVWLHTPSTGADHVERLQYAACLIVGEGQSDALVATLPVIESEFSTLAFRILVGRDVLKSCTFTYDGPSGAFELVWGVDRPEPPAIQPGS